MALKDSLLAEFDHEMASTRKTLERVPEDRFAWKPHEKSGAMGWLAAHVAEIPGWAAMILNTDSLDIEPPGGQQYKTPLAESRAQLLAGFDEKTAAARQAIDGASDEEMSKPWSLLAGGRVAFTMPRAAVLRSFVMNHLIHHRAQLGVYLRLNDIPVPAVYGPSADEAPPM